MGGRSVEAFFISCDDHYLAKNLSSIRDEVMAEGEALTNYVRGHIIQRRKWGEFDKERARELWGDAEGIEITNSYCSNPGLMTAVVGDEWWYDLPMVDNPDYTYLCRIIQAVRDGLREYTKSTPAAAVHIPVENEHLFRFKMNADSGLRVHHFRTPQSTNSDVR